MEDQLALTLTCLKLLLSFPSFGSTGASIERENDQQIFEDDDNILSMICLVIKLLSQTTWDWKLLPPFG